jgi:hypothetical protein
MVVLEELAEQPMEVAPTEDDDVLEQLAPNGADEGSATPFCHGYR